MSSASLPPPSRGGSCGGAGSAPSPYDPTRRLGLRWKLRLFNRTKWPLLKPGDLCGTFPTDIHFILMSSPLAFGSSAISLIIHSGF
ncbi:hypothetical protein EI555_016809 [Monodon monoceros]|uniref:Uncharacterized protein n=1 Tax=Monodon monoceros TaxID=40151 RepID=A0A4U1ERB5_MONMO|nr:hypothetical protein EI555_016809 [Monodon monoceros]